MKYSERQRLVYTVSSAFIKVSTQDPDPSWGGGDPDPDYVFDFLYIFHFQLLHDEHMDNMVRIIKIIFYLPRNYIVFSCIIQRQDIFWMTSSNLVKPSLAITSCVKLVLAPLGSIPAVFPLVFLSSVYK